MRLWRRSDADGGRALRVLTATVAATALATVVVLGILAWSWGDQLHVEQRLLPGITIAGVEVGGLAADDALAAVQASVEPELHRELAFIADRSVWHTTLAELGASTDAAEVVASATARTGAASILELMRYRWLGQDPQLHLEVTIEVPPSEAANFVDAVAAGVDHPPRDARLAWSDRGRDLVLVRSRDGRQVERTAAVAAVRAAADRRSTHVELPVSRLAPEVTSELAEQALPTVRAAVDHVLDRRVTLAHGEQSWTLSPRDLDAIPDVGSATNTAIERLSGQPDTTPASHTPARALPAGEVPLVVPEGQLTAFVGGLAAEIDIAPRAAEIAWTGAELAVTPEVFGLALDRDAATTAVRDALTGAADTVVLPVLDVEPSVTTASFRRVLLVRQDLRQLFYHVDGEVVRDWPVAVGTGGSPTPAGVFWVGAKRHLPTWHNPAPTGWGADMPRVIPPGPTNPLGVRALNWNHDGRDTLIRFHGTANLRSIGQAASQGCVRLSNPDVVELFDLVPTGTAIVSVAE